ncbi:MAG: hypothetical protein LBL43_02425, partial [Treponema sp.]|nr:hypothetical protein [Treponema sp.]
NSMLNKAAEGRCAMDGAGIMAKNRHGRRFLARARDRSGNPFAKQKIGADSPVFCDEKRRFAAH